MIEWNKADEIQPLEGETYLVSDGDVVDFGRIERGAWYLFDRDSDDYFPVIYYALINIPESGGTGDE